MLRIVKRLCLLLFLLMILAPYILAAENPRWVSMPVKVYISEQGKMSSLMREAFESWEKKSDSLVRFKFVRDNTNSDIEVDFVDFVSNCNSTHSVGCTEYYVRKRNYSKAFITIGTKEYVREYVNGRMQRKIVERPKEHIYGVMLHEAGHSIGLGHSESTKSIMYPYDLETMQYLTDEDMRLLYKKYH